MRQLFLRTLGFVVLLVACASCGAQSRAGKLQDAAVNLNQATRFGRQDIAMEMVDAKAMDEFVKQHSAWGREVRLVDLEMQGLQFKDKDTAIILVMIGWQRQDEQELRVTQISQTWTYGKQGWRLTDESRSAGDVGLLGETTVVMKPESHADMHYRSITIPGPL